MFGVLRRMFNANEREIRRLQGAVEGISSLEPGVAGLDDAALRGKTAEFRGRLERGESLDDLLPEAFAVVREASRRVLGQRHFDVQLMGGIALHEGRIAEMRTGEGKTLVATLPAYLNALTGEGVHIVTVNDYLAKRDSQWMGQIYRFLGLTVGVIVHDLEGPARRRNYAADITYGTQAELGFDYLRDNMVDGVAELTQRHLHYAILDEVDSILIDEARTPLIISGATEKPTEMYYRFAALVEDLEPETDYTVDEKLQTVAPHEDGIHKIERALGVDNLYDVGNMDLSHYLENALKARSLMKRDEKYIVKDGEVVIVDEFTGRLMFGRRWGHGLHEAVEAKEGCKIPQGTQTMATITFQNFFRLYDKLAGMTGTAATEEEEFHKIYKLDVVIIPTNMPMIRDDLSDIVYRTENGKYRAVVGEIAECHGRGQPVLVGTVDIAKNERLSKMLDRAGVPHQVLNAKHHEKEAQIIAQAGRAGAVTIATNMAGRGTDILLGGNPEYLARERLLAEGVESDLVALASEKVPPGEDPGDLTPTPIDEGEAARRRRVAELSERYRDLVERFTAATAAEHGRVVAAGGLRVIGTERHESRRIDNQLRGRSGRQGDPGSSRFYLSLEDSLMRLFGGDTLQRAMVFFKVDEDEPIESPMVTRAIEQAQRKVESRNFEARKQVLDYDDVLNQQREVIYSQRRQILLEDDVHPIILQMVEDVIGALVSAHCADNTDAEDWDLPGLCSTAEQSFCPAGRLSAEDLGTLENPAAVRQRLLDEAQAIFAEREALLQAGPMRDFERTVLLQVVTHQWVAHLDAMDDLREGIGLRAYGQLDPLTQYKLEAFEMFEEMVGHIREQAVQLTFLTRVIQATPAQREALLAGQVPPATEEDPAQVPALVAAGGGAAAQTESPPRTPPAATVASLPKGPRLPPREADAARARRHPSGRKVRRNEPCPCGSGKKYKHCCGR